MSISSAPPEAVTPSADSAVRALTDDGSFRIITIESTSMVQGAIEKQAASGSTAQTFAELLTGAVLVRETMAPTLRVQGILKGIGGKGSLVADSFPDGTTRGLVQLRSTPKLELGEGALLQMMRTLPNGALHQGVVEVPPEGGISGGLMAYMQQSEQVVSVAAVAALPSLRDAAPVVDRAGGYIVQLLPGADPDAVSEMIEKLEALPPMPELLRRDGFTPKALLGWVLGDAPYAIVEERPVSFGCNCSQERLLASLASLDRGEVVEMVEEGKVLEITCDYCGEDYRISPEQLRGLVSQS